METIKVKTRISKRLVSGLIATILIMSSGCATMNAQPSEAENENSTPSKSSAQEANPLWWILGFAIGWSIGESLGDD